MTTITWLSWMPHLRSWNIDAEILLDLTINNININPFLSRKLRIVQQIKNLAIDPPLTMVSRLGTSTSLRAIHLKQSRVSSQPITDESFLRIYQICHNACKLKVMKIEFSTAFFCPTMQYWKSFTEQRRKSVALSISICQVLILSCGLNNDSELVRCFFPVEPWQGLSSEEAIQIICYHCPLQTRSSCSKTVCKYFHSILPTFIKCC